MPRFIKTEPEGYRIAVLAACIVAVLSVVGCVAIIVGDKVPAKPDRPSAHPLTSPSPLRSGESIA